MDLNKIREARDMIIDACNTLNEEFKPLFKVSPDLFPKPLPEMGAGDKLKFANDLLVLNTMMMHAVQPKD